MLRPHVTVNTAELMRPHSHGEGVKDLVVCHETVSHDIRGLADGNEIASYLAAKDYGIHGIIDHEGHLWWAKGLSTAIFWHCASSGTHGDGQVNTRSIGVELVKYPTGNAVRDYRAWMRRERQLAKLARVIAWQSRVHRIPLRYSDGSRAGVTTHWSVSTRFGVPGGHTDCHPRHEQGYFPVLRVIRMARALRGLRP